MSIPRVDTTKAVAIIPVRAGSKEVPNKNLRLVRGRPLLAYTIESALVADHLDHAIVSTDGEDIAEFATSQGIAVVLHPPSLSTDDARTFPVIQWAMRHLLAGAEHFDTCVTLRATTPFRTAADVDGALAAFRACSEADSLVSVCELTGAHPRRLKTINSVGWLEDSFLSEGGFPARRQELDPVFIRNGGIYIAKSAIIESGALWGERCLPYVMPPERSLNINTSWDFELAEMIAARQANLIEFRSPAAQP